MREKRDKEINEEGVRNKKGEMCLTGEGGKIN